MLSGLTHEATAPEAAAYHDGGDHGGGMQHVLGGGGQNVLHIDIMDLFFLGGFATRSSPAQHGKSAASAAIPQQLPAPTGRIHLARS